MRRVVYTLLLILTSLVAAAQVKHYVTFSGHLGEASYLYDVTNVPSTSSLGVGGGIGVGYELKYDALLFDIGLSFNMTHSIANVGRLDTVFAGMKDDDPWGSDKFDYVYHQTQRKDAYSNLSLQVPIMIGAMFKRFYFLAGAKLDLSVMARAKAKAIISSEADYEAYGIAPPMSHIPTFNNYPFIQRTSVKFQPQVMVSAEIGWRLGEIATGTGYDVPKAKRYWRIALFADYGLMNMLDKSDNPIIEFNQASSGDMKDIKLHNIFSTSDAVKVQNLMVGVKATYVFQLPEQKACTVCRDAYRGTSAGSMSRGKGRIESDRMPSL